MALHQFKKGEKYGRPEIAKLLGGSAINYLPRQSTRIVCGCFNKTYNPDAPDVVLPGTGPEIEYSAKLFCAQKTLIPIFIRLGPKEWEFVGEYKVARHSTDPVEIKAHHHGSITPLNKVTRVMFLSQTA